MSYNTFLDAFFSNWILNLGSLSVVMVVLSYVRSKFISFSKVIIFINILFPVIIFIWVFTFLLLNALYLGYGHPKGVSGVMLSENRLFVVDFLLGGGSRATSSTRYARIHILDPETGKKTLRFSTGEAGALTGIKGDSLIFYGEDLLKIFSSSNGKLIGKLGRKTLPDVFPELSAGIDNVMVSRSDNVLELKTLDGKRYNLSMETATIYPEVSKNRYNEKSKDRTIFINNEKEIKTNAGPAGTVLLTLGGEDGNQEIRYIKGKNRNKINDNEFLMGKFIAVSEKQNCFVVLSYETTKKSGLILTCLTLDGKEKLWELRNDILRVEDDSEDPLTTEYVTDDNSGKLFFAVKDEIISFDIKTGDIIWRQKL
ncbi:MAG: hypothetical protein WCK13_00915 [Ignavibacteriota bacterium]|nr:hypothetical protein [Ignavibacteriota bacterium]